LSTVVRFSTVVRTLTCIVVALSACAVPIRNVPLAVRHLVPASTSQRPRPELGVIVESVTAENAADHGDIVKHVAWSTTSISGGHESAAAAPAGKGSGFAMPASSAAAELREDDVALLSLPAFRVELKNDRDEPLPLDRLRFELDDGIGGSYTPLDNAEGTAAMVLRDLFQRHPELRDADQVQVREGVRAAALGVPTWIQPAPLPPHGHRVAWVSFRLIASDAAALGRIISQMKRLTLRVHGLDEKPLDFIFWVATKHEQIHCPDGSLVEHSRDCKRMDPLPLQPTAGGPCIQHTHIKYSMAFTQWWMGSTPIANSDLDRTLLSSPESHDDQNRADKLRGAGYGLLGTGILGAGATSALLGWHLGSEKSYYGLSLLGLVPVAVALVYSAVKLGDRAIDSFNTASEQSGLCVPVW
jgi:hypothetical protein